MKLDYLWVFFFFTVCLWQREYNDYAVEFGAIALIKALEVSINICWGKKISVDEITGNFKSKQKYEKFF